jgi:hypothetical protein
MHGDTLPDDDLGLDTAVVEDVDGWIVDVSRQFYHVELPT